MSKPAAILSLVGARGSGKSTVGRLLADQLLWDFADSDTEVERDLGRTIPEIFAGFGERTFRAAEMSAVAYLLQRKQLVVATGGGAVLNERTRSVLRKTGPVAYLTADAATLHARTDGDANRPALTNLPAAEETARVLADRDPLYREVADAVIDTAGRTPAEVASAVLAALADRLPPPAA